jgi:Protein of unknown function (DUF1638)
MWLIASLPHYTSMSPDRGRWHTPKVPKPILVIACGALAREITELKKSHGWEHVDLASIDAWLHMRPDKIPDRLRNKIRQFKDRYDHIFVAYADCGTAGGIDKVLAEEGVERLPGAHCYEFFAGAPKFAALAEAEPGTFYLTDFLAQHFERFVIRPLKIDSHPELRDAYFGNYRRLVFLSQTNNEETLAAARDAAVQLGLEFEHEHCGFGDLERGLSEYVMRQSDG